MSGLRCAILVTLTCAALHGCSRDAQPPASQPTTSAPATPSAEAPKPQPESEPIPLLPESASWSREEALARLSEETASLSAAVRLVRLADVAPLCIPDPLPPKIARRLRVLALSESRWALGLSTPDETRLQSPVLIDATGEVTLPMGGVDEEVALLCRAEDPDLFPHLLIILEQVFTVGEDVQPALRAKSPPALSFDLRFDDEIPYLALLWHGDRLAAGEGVEGSPTTRPADLVADEPVELARYSYDAYELAFMGPLSDKLPEPPGGLFELDLEASVALIPVGGVIPKPPKVEPPVFEPIEGQPTPY